MMKRSRSSVEEVVVSNKKTKEVEAAEEEAAVTEEKVVESTNEEVEATEDNVAEEEEAISWVQCDACGKWRSWPSGEELPEGSWYCQDNKFDPAHNTCEAEEEEQGDDVVEDEYEEEEEEEETAEEMRQRIHREFEAKREAKEQKQAELKAQRAIVKEERRKERMQLEEQEASALIASWTEEEKAARKKEAMKKNSRRQLPVHLYPKQYSDKKATSMLMIDFLLGVDIDAADSIGRTPLHYAVMNDCELYEKYLRDKDVDPCPCDHGDKCPDEYRILKQPKSMWDKFI